MSGLVQVQNEELETRCPHCGAEVSHDQRYCLSCGRPCAALRSPLIDLLGDGSAERAAGSAGGFQSGYQPALQGERPSGPLQRHAGLFALVAMLLLTGVIGMLIGHWAAGSGEGGTGTQVVKIEGLGGSTAPAVATAATTSTSSTAGSAKEIEHETKQEERETAATNLAKPVKPSAAAQKHLSKLTGKKYEQEINKLANGPAPIETGG